MGVKRLALCGVWGSLVLLAVSIVACGPSEEEKAAMEATKVAEKRAGFHCLSAWDGNHDQFEVIVKANLNDPDSMKTYETRITPANDQGQHTILMDFGARNAFGGMVRSQAVGWVDNETCEATLLGIE